MIKMKKVGFFKAYAMKIKGIKSRSHAHWQGCGIPPYFRGPAYSLEGCSPAEPSSASAGDAKLTHVNQLNKLTYQHVN
jgi:hypothetical protein